MKVLFILILSILTMSNMGFDLLLGNNIVDASFIGVAKNVGDETIYNISNPKVEFLGKKIDQIVIATDENKAIQRIIIFLPQPIDTSFYKIISKEYGSIYKVMVVDKVLPQDPSSSKMNNEFSDEVLTQVSMSLKEGNINKNEINHVLWDKNNFQIMLYYNYPKNRMDVHFIKN